MWIANKEIRIKTVFNDNHLIQIKHIDLEITAQRNKEGLGKEDWNVNETLDFSNFSF